MLRSLNTRRAISLLVSAAATAAALWTYGSQPRLARSPGSFVPIEDGKTVDVSEGKGAVTDSPADKAAVDAAVKDMDAASKDVSFPAEPAPKK
jgi:hypothetical protein